MNRNPYTAAEDAMILQARENGASFPKMARMLNRSHDTVKARWRRLTDYHKARPYPGCAALVERQIATGQYQVAGLMAWQERHS